MNLKDFENDIQSTLLQKGLTYFEDELVDDLEKVAAGLWVAQVHGSDTYIVSVKTNRTQIKGWECNCPYDHGPICKHVIATFFAIRGEMNFEAKSPVSSPKKPKDNTAEIFKKSTKAELEKFI